MDVNMSGRVRATMLTPSSLAKLQPQSSLLKSKITNTYKIIENGDLNLSARFISVNSAEVYEIRSVLSDITNITQSTKQCLTNLTHVNERNSDILAGKVETKKKDFSSNKQSKARLDRDMVIDVDNNRALVPELNQQSDNGCASGSSYRSTRRTVPPATEVGSNLHTNSRGSGHWYLACASFMDYTIYTLDTREDDTTKVQRHAVIRRVCNALDFILQQDKNKQEIGKIHELSKWEIKKCSGIPYLPHE
ncbi:hypothetical protein RIF29_10647 [Crotalaria pallida]|uniref:Ubiquitin-like protease family profile domain-containing protein n=1 Tax=Crotalaria pallida TaxID=3830 RepID=A0AAN9FZ38_CROPI